MALTCLGLTGTRNGQASSCFSISAKIMRHGAMSLEACFRLACGRTSSLGGGVRGRLSSFSSSSSLNFRFRRGLLRFYGYNNKIKFYRAEIIQVRPLYFTVSFSPGEQGYMSLNSAPRKNKELQVHRFKNNIKLTLLQFGQVHDALGTLQR